MTARARRVTRLSWRSSGPDERVYIAQLLLGFGITLLFFYIGWKITGRGWFGALAALLHTFNAQQFLFEADLMTETLATFWIALAFAGMAFLLDDRAAKEEIPAWKLIGAAALTGLAAGLSILTRPLFIYLPFWIAFFLVVCLARTQTGHPLVIGASRASARAHPGRLVG